MAFDWNILFKSLNALPYIVAGIQQIHAEAPGASKKQLALDSLGLATAAAGAILPAEQGAQAQAVGTAVGNIIDNLVAAFHATNVPGFGNSSLGNAVNVPATTVKK